MTARPADASQDLLATLSDLVRIRSVYPPGNTAAMADDIAGRLRSFGYDAAVVGPDDTVRNVVAAIGSGHPEILLCTHIDTVGAGTLAHWTADPFDLRIDGDTAYGLGAENCKGAAAVFLKVARRVVELGGPRAGRIVFAFVGDEENLGGRGAKYLREQGLTTPDIAVLGGPTGCQLCCEERGVLWLRVSCTGRAFHAGTPERGDNALMRAVRLIAALDRELPPRLATRRADPFVSTVSISRIGGGHDINTVPDACWFELDRRILPEEDTTGALAEIRDILANAGEPDGTWSIEVLVESPGFRPGRDGPGVRAHAAAIEEMTGVPAVFLVNEGASDGRHFAGDGVEILNFGGGAGDRSHAPDESVELAQLQLASEIQLRALELLVSGWTGTKASA